MAGMTVFGSCSQSGVGSPIRARKVLSGLISGLNSHSQMAATAMLDVTCGAKKNTR